MAFEKQDQRYYSNPKLVELKSVQKNIVFKKLRLTSLWLNPQGSRELKKGRDKMENISEINPNLFKKLICWKQ